VSSIFVSYRREDTAGHTGRLCDVLRERFGQSEIFQDIDSIAPGEDFAAKIQEIIPRCRVMLVIIGRQWITALNRHDRGVPDYTRFEVAIALDSSIEVIPVLVDRAEMPSASQLPPDIVKLASLNAFEIADRRFRTDAADLVTTLELPPEDRNWRYNQKIPVEARVLGDKIVTPLKVAFKRRRNRDYPEVTVVRWEKFAYYSLIEKTDGAQPLVTILRHKESGERTLYGMRSRTVDEVFSRSLIWEASPLLNEVQTGNAKFDLTEITEEEAYRIVNRRRLLVDPDAS
jgi:hypothetical protein